MLKTKYRAHSENHGKTKTGSSVIELLSLLCVVISFTLMIEKYRAKEAINNDHTLPGRMVT